MAIHEGQELRAIYLKRSANESVLECDQVLIDDYIILRGAILGSNVRQYIYNTSVSLIANPAQVWSDLNVYARQHQYLIPYINNDPAMCHSLVDTGRTRYAISGGGLTNYIDTNVIGNNNTRIIYEGKLIQDTVGDNIVIFGSDYNFASRNVDAWLRYTQYNADSIGFGGSISYSSSTTPMTPLNEKFVIDANKNYWTNRKADGTINWSITFNIPSSFTTPYSIIFFNFRRNGSVITPNPPLYCSSFKISDNDNNKHYIPYKKNNTIEMLDIITTESSGEESLGIRYGTLTDIVE